uniref:Uncharacterized protein n=1 Tax=Cacopsylla melanoneura TaxID=428564 RepID=A0A8D8WAD1_9HEMI
MFCHDMELDDTSLKEEARTVHTLHDQLRMILEHVRFVLFVLVRFGISADFAMMRFTSCLTVASAISDFQTVHVGERRAKLGQMFPERLRGQLGHFTEGAHVAAC